MPIINEMSELIGKSGGVYQRTNKKIGRGAFSKVYKGLDIEKDLIVAIKVIEKDSIQNRMKNRLKGEIELHSSFDHPNIIKMFDFIEDSENYYIILEYCSDGDLHHFIKLGKIPENVVKNYTRQLAAGLKYLKDRNIVHRDLKPHNILLMENYKVLKLTDFNFARRLWDQQMAETLCGSPLYMAPEIIETKDYTNRSDLWSVGMIIYEMLHGNTPYNDAINPMDLLRKIRKRKIIYCSKISRDAVFLISGLLTIDPLKRTDWKEFFEHRWLQEKSYIETISDTESSDSYEELYDKTPLDAHIIEDYEREYDEDFYKVPHSDPMAIIPKKNEERETSSFPTPNNITKGILGYMTTSVGSAVRGTFNYLSQ